MIATAPSLVTTNNCFGFHLLQQLSAVNAQQNVFISPASIVLALSMTGNGADGATSRALHHALHLPDLLDWPAANAAHAALWEGVRLADPQAVLESANSVWAEPGFAYAPRFRLALAQHYAADVGNVDFLELETAAATINSWVAAKTHDKIPRLLQPADLVAAVLVLINAIYFKGIWTEPFPRGQTEPGEFYLPTGSKLQLAMMRRAGRFHYAEYEQWQMISLPFGLGRFGLIIVLPQHGITLAQLQASLNADTWSGWLDRLQLPQAGIYRTWEKQMLEFGRRPGRIVLPRFKLNHRIELLPQLALRANSFPHMADPPDPSLQISKVIHQSVLEVNEEGAEAAAATAVVAARSLPQQPFHMIVNRPFLCAIRDNLTGLLLFMGTVYQPEVYQP